MPVQIDEESYKLLRDSGGDPALSQHIFHVFIRDALVIFDLWRFVEELDDEIQTEHFESIQSTNWYVIVCFWKSWYILYYVGLISDYFTN